MENDWSMLYQAIKIYGLDPETLNIENKLTGLYHKDHHYKIRVRGKYYSARLISGHRYEHDVFVELTDQVLEQQMEYIDFLRRNSIPFMGIPSSGNKFIKFNWKGVDYRFLLFDWIDGKHITHCTEGISYKFGKMARKIHDISSNYIAELPKISQVEGSKKFISILKDAISTANVSSKSQLLLHDYLILANKHMEKAYVSNLDFIMQSDFNPLNVLWDDQENVVGIVDFEHIGYGDRMEGLAWLIKWYSRTKGIASHDVSPELAKNFLMGYGAQDFLGKEEKARLSSLLWLTGCLNWGFVHKTKNILEQKDYEQQLEDHIAKFHERGLKLSSVTTDFQSMILTK